MSLSGEDLTKKMIIPDEVHVVEDVTEVSMVEKDTKHMVAAWQPQYAVFILGIF